MKKYPEPKPHQNFEIFYGKNNNNKIKKLGQGGNGAIFLVSWTKSSRTSGLGRTRRGIPIDDKIVLKYPITEPEYEPDLVTKVLKGYHHHIIPYRIIHDQHGNPFVIMQQANGDVSDLLEHKLTSSFRNKMISYYAKSIGQLWRKRIVFTDMKPENLLYQCISSSAVHGGGNSSSSGGITLFFGDIGSFAKEGAEEYIYEVEPPECDGAIDKNFCLFTLGLMAIGMYNIDYKRPVISSSWSGTMKSFEDNFYYPVRKQVLTYIKNRQIRDITLRLLSPDRKERDRLTVNEAVGYLID